MNSTIIVLSLHRVGRPEHGAKIRGLFTSHKLIRFEVWLLRSLGFVFTTLSDAFDHPHDKIAVLTFDDGYADNISQGLPLLDTLGLVATIFPVTSDVGRHGVVWAEAGEDLPSDMITWNELDKLRGRGWEIGTHAAKHVHMDRYSPDEQIDLVRSSVRAIEEMLGHSPVSFAYPYGVFNEATKTALRSAGILFAVTTLEPSKDEVSHNPDRLEIGRIPLGGCLAHHYMRAFLRTLRAVGMWRVLRAMTMEKLADLISAKSPRASGQIHAVGSIEHNDAR